MSVRYLAGCFNWSHGMAQRFLELLIENSTISRVVCETVGKREGEEFMGFRRCECAKARIHAL